MEEKLISGMSFGKLTLIEPTKGYKWKCICDCGNISTPTSHNLRNGGARSCGNCGKNYYSDCDDGKSVEVIATNGIKFYIDKSDEALVRLKKWSVCKDKKGFMSVLAADKTMLYRWIVNVPKGFEIDHIDMDRLNNRRSNLRICTHQQNQINQGLQSNNTSGVAGVRFVKRKNKFQARIKVSGHTIHLGYYTCFDDAVKARNIAMKCMFGAYGRYNDVGEISKELEEDVIRRCIRFSDLAAWSAFFDFWDIEDT